MNYFIKKIHVNKLFHLENFDIPIANASYPHLIITGKNGSGKTILLNAIANKLNRIKDNISLGFLNLASNVDLWKKKLTTETSEKDIAHAKMMLQEAQKAYDDFFEKLDITFINYDLIDKYSKGDFVIAYYKADRHVIMIEPNAPQKPIIQTKNNIDESTAEHFITFLVDLKFQELLAISKNQKEDKERITNWFVNFENMLKEIYQDDDLSLHFSDEEKKYSFKIVTKNKEFGFNEMADGFKAAINIVADLILKMQSDGIISDAYKKEGIVLIDEIETHLHLELQRIIMPFMTRTFPNIQFIVTTHSPFVLSSMPNAVAYDLEHKKPIENLTNYSYESLAEGYFGVRAESSDVRHRLNRVKELLEKEELSVSEIDTLKKYINDFDNIPEAVSPSLIGEYLKLKLKYVNKIKELMQ